MREANDLRVDAGDSAWYATDPDSLYHLRRLDRALEEGLPVAPRDPLLAFPEGRDVGGTAVPWPPYYTLFLYALLAPRAPEDPGRREVFVEQCAASVPAWCAVLASVVAALAAGHLAGPGAALVAGVYHAFLFGSLKYSYFGNGDHHAWTSLLFALILSLTGRALRGAALERTAGSALRGAACGVLAGLLVGSWVAGIVYVLLVQVALGWMLCARDEGGRRGLSAFGLAFHGAALLALLPAVLASPWSRESPFAVLFLSWFHPAQLVLGALVFVPPLALSGDRWRRGYPLLVVAVLSGLGLAIAFTGTGAAVREGLAWAGGADRFMHYITESQPLAWGTAGSADALFKFLGFGALGLPVAWVFAARRVLRGEHELVPWVAAAPGLLALALCQRRFADGFAVTEAVLLGWGAATWFAARGPRFARVTPGGALALGLFLPIAANPAVARTTVLRLNQAGRFVETPELDHQRGIRRLAEWLRGNTPPPGDPPEYCVLAQWDLGHLIEWAGRRPTVGTNFGLYVGEDSYLDPWRFLLAEDPVAAEAILAKRRARYVLVTSRVARNLDTMVRLLRPGEERLLAGGFDHCVGGRLAGGEPGDGLGFLRLVHVAPGPARGTPYGWIFERVSGARLEARGTPGGVLEVRLASRYPGAERALRWTARATVGADGVARLRVPYATDAMNGEGRAVGPLTWRLDGREGRSDVPERAVRTGEPVIVR